MTYERKVESLRDQLGSAVIMAKRHLKQLRHQPTHILMNEDQWSVFLEAFNLPGDREAVKSYDRLLGLHIILTNVSRPEIQARIDDKPVACVYLDL